ncbi:MAG TPA: hypothetical protein VIJ40_01170 [Acidimicrobiales bacterium]
MVTLRSDDWSVRPSFVPHGPTSPVTLLADETGLTQLAGIPSVAWQTPWSELSNLELVRFSHQMALFGTVGGVRYCWRQRSLADFEAVRALVLEHGGSVIHRRRRAGVVVVVAVVLLATLAGGIASWANHGNLGDEELADAQAVNLTLKDLPSSWYISSSSVLQQLVGPTNKVFTSTTVTTTPPAKNSAFVKAATIFQSCLGVTNKTDRVYGAAGQQADYQVSSPVFDTNALGGIELVSTSQYYRTTTMVKKDTKEMSMKNFGACLTASSANLILAGTGVTGTERAKATNWQPTTFIKGWSSGGMVPFSLSGLPTKLQLVEAVVTHGHYEVTMVALVGSFTKAKSFLSSVVNTLLSRTVTSTSKAV